MTGEGEVDIVDWPGYVERGANDPKYDWVTGFEKQTGCMVKVKDAATSDEMVQLINSGGFDLVTASGDASLRLVYGKSVQEIDISRIPSYKNVDPRLQNAPWHTVGWQTLRRHLSMGSQRFDVQHEGFPNCADLMERGLHCK